MTTPSLPEPAILDSWRQLAHRYPATIETGVCARVAFKAGKKSFFFMGHKAGTYNAMLKLKASLDEAEALQEDNPESYQIGAHGWVTVTYRSEQQPPEGLMERWMDESYRLLAPKKLLAKMGT